MAMTPGVQERRMVLYNVGWDTYERLLRDHANASAPRFTYDRGTLEIMSPLPEHERFNRAIQLLHRRVTHGATAGQQGYGRHCLDPARASLGACGGASAVAV